MANVSVGAAPAAFSFSTFAHAVRSNPGAVLRVENGEFSVQLVPANNGRVAWIKLEDAARASEARKPKVSEQQRASVQLRYEVTAEGKSDTGFRLSVKKDHKAKAYELDVNRLRNAEVAEAFVRQLQRSVLPELQLKMTRSIRERLVELPPPVFASEVARIASGADEAAGLQFPMREAMAREFDYVPGFSSASASSKETILATAMALWADDVSAGRSGMAASDYVDPALNAFRLAPSERRSREAIVMNMQARLKASGLEHRAIGAELARLRNSAATMSSPDFRDHVRTLRGRVDKEIDGAAAVLKQASAAIAEAAEVLGSHMKELRALKAQRPATAMEGESPSAFQARQRAWDRDYAREYSRRVDSLVQRVGPGVKVPDVQMALHHVETHDLLDSPGLRADALKKFNESQANGVATADQSSLHAAHFNALTQALRQQLS